MRSKPWLAAMVAGAVAAPHRGRELRRRSGLGARHRLAQLAAADGDGAARQGGARRLLDLYLHQLAADVALRPRVGREVQGSGARRDRRAHAGIRVRERRRRTFAAPWRRWASLIPSRPTTTTPSGARSTTILAGALLRRRARTRPIPPFRRGRVRGRGTCHPAAACRSRARRRRARPRLGRGARHRSGGGLGELEVAGDLPRLRARCGLLIAPGRVVQRAPEVPGSDALGTQSVGALGQLDDEAPGDSTLNEARRSDRVPLSRARRSSRDGPGGEWNRSALSRTDRRTARPERLTAATSTSKATAS